MVDLQSTADTIVGLIRKFERATGSPDSKASVDVLDWCNRVLVFKPGQVKECRHCEGTGEVEDYSDGPNRVGHETCGVCDGDKVVPVKYPRI